MIVCDPTELRQGTKSEVGGIAISMPGLEAATAADIGIFENTVGENVVRHEKSEDIGRLLSSNIGDKEISDQLGLPIPIILGVKKFWIETQRGMLIQRKSGSDLIGSIPEMSRILEKMMVWTRRPWLLTTGNFTSSPTGTVVVNGRRTDFSYSAYLGAIDAWQERGGYIVSLEKDSLIPMWIKYKEKKLGETKSEKVIYFRKPLQTIVGPEDENAWVSTLATFKGIDTVLASRIGEFAGSLASALCMMSDPKFPFWDERPKGFGVVLSKYARQRLGLLDGQQLKIVRDEEEIIWKGNQ